MNQYVKSSVKVVAIMMAFGTFPVFAESDVSDVVAAPEVQGADALKGFTVGADLAYNYSEAKHEGQSVSINMPGLTPMSQGMSDQIKHRRCNIDPSINVGYTYVYNNWYMGVAGDISFGKKGKRDTAFGANTNAHTRISGFAGDIKLKGGYFVNDLKSAIYGIAGIKWRNVDYQFNVNGNSGSKAKLKSPLFLVGLGFEKPIYKKLSVSAEYEYAWRNSKDNSSRTLSSGSWKCDVNQRLNDRSFKIGIKYHI